MSFPKLIREHRLDSKRMKVSGDIVASGGYSVADADIMREQMNWLSGRISPGILPVADQGD